MTIRRRRGEGGNGQIIIRLLTRSLTTSLQVALLCLLYLYVDIQINIRNTNELSWAINYHRVQNLSKYKILKFLNVETWL